MGTLSTKHGGKVWTVSLDPTRHSGIPHGTDTPGGYQLSPMIRGVRAMCRPCESHAGERVGGPALTRARTRGPTGIRTRFVPCREGSEHRSLSEAHSLVGLTGLEPVTSSLSGTRSNQLSYRPIGAGEVVPRTEERLYRTTSLTLNSLSPRPVSPRGRRSHWRPRCTRN